MTRTKRSLGWKFETAFACAGSSGLQDAVGAALGEDMEAGAAVSSSSDDEVPIARRRRKRRRVARRLDDSTTESEPEPARPSRLQATSVRCANICNASHSKLSMQFPSVLVILQVSGNTISSFHPFPGVNSPVNTCRLSAAERKAIAKERQESGKCTTNKKYTSSLKRFKVRLF